MSIKDTFEQPGFEFFSNAPGFRVPGRDPIAVEDIKTLFQIMPWAPDSQYARGTWGYTIKLLLLILRGVSMWWLTSQVFRTVHTEESDRLFPIAMEKLYKWLTQYHFHATRFHGWLWIFDYQAIRDYDPAQRSVGKRGWMKMYLCFLE